MRAHAVSQSASSLGEIEGSATGDSSTLGASVLHAVNVKMGKLLAPVAGCCGERPCGKTISILSPSASVMWLPLPTSLPLTNVPFCERSSSRASTHGARSPCATTAPATRLGQRTSWNTLKCWLLMYGIGALWPIRMSERRERPTMYDLVQCSRYVVVAPSTFCAPAGGTGLRPTSVPQRSCRSHERGALGACASANRSCAYACTSRPLLAWFASAVAVRFSRRPARGVSRAGRASGGGTSCAMSSCASARRASGSSDQRTSGSRSGSCAYLSALGRGEYHCTTARSTCISSKQTSSSRLSTACRMRWSSSAKSGSFSMTETKSSVRKSVHRCHSGSQCTSSDLCSRSQQLSLCTASRRNLQHASRSCSTS
mmetsp:Transcript_13314/g.35412  ORF Transcript_13314/g.35412 Transcript_13314/m.35412 type:complete len:371 (-) Transcript_13314:56-1168(-)